MVATTHRKTLVWRMLFSASIFVGFAIFALTTEGQTLPRGPRSPYNGSPAQVPGQFEAEDFDNGGEGIAYHDLTAGNQGGRYRTAEDVDIISPYAGGFVVNNFQTGEWLEYTINVTEAGTYRFQALVSSQYTTSRFHIEVDGTDVTGAINAPNTGAWTTFQWVGEAGIGVTAGQHLLRIVADAQYFNLDAIRIGRKQTPFSGSPAQVPGRFEAEDFDKGGEGVAYHDLVPGNQGGFYRTTEDVDIINPYPGGFVVNNFQTGEWLEYTINVSQAATYRIEALVSSQYTTSRFHIEIDRTDKTGLISVPNTGWWVNFQWVGKDGISLPAGEHILRITADMQYFNLDAIRIVGMQTPFNGAPAQVPGMFEAEDFDLGGEGIAYHDLVPGNAGGQYRPTEDVDIISPYPGGFVVNNFETGEWLEYTIDVTQSGTYTFEAWVSSEYTFSRFHIEVDGTDVTGLISVPNTGAWTAFQWVGKDGVSVTAGQHVLRIFADAQYFNLDAIRIRNGFVEAPIRP